MRATFCDARHEDQQSVIECETVPASPSRMTCGFSVKRLAVPIRALQRNRQRSGYRPVNWCAIAKQMHAQCSRVAWIATQQKKAPPVDRTRRRLIWLRELDLNQRPSGYEPDE